MAEPIYYRDVGEGAGPPLLLIHGGFTDGSGAWAVQLQSLPERYRLLVVDRRGHGESPREPRPYTITGDAEDVLEAADKAGAEIFHAVGHSYGGLVALEVACRAPERIKSLHLIEPPYLTLLPDDPDVAYLAHHGATIFAQAAEWGAERTVAEFFNMIAGPDVVSQLRSRPIWASLVREAKRTAYEQFPATYPAGALKRLRITGPVNVYTGGRSHPGLRKVAQHLAGLLPGARLVEVPEAAHDVQRAREPFEEALLAVIDGK